MRTILRSSSVEFIRLTIVMAIGVVIGLGIQYATAQYTSPPGSPPSGNISNPPLTTGATQTKSGGLTVGGTLQTNTRLNTLSSSWGAVLRNTSGVMNANTRSSVGSINVNDIYLRSAGKWVSDAISTTGFSEHQWIRAYGFEATASCPDGWTRLSCVGGGFGWGGPGSNSCFCQDTMNMCTVYASCIR